MEIYCQIVLRGNNPDSFNYFNIWVLRIMEKGIMNVTVRHTTIDSSNAGFRYFIITENGYLTAYQTYTSTDITITNVVFPSNDAPEVILYGDGDGDIYGTGFFLYMNIIIMGV